MVKPSLFTKPIRYTSGFDATQLNTEYTRVMLQLSVALNAVKTDLQYNFGRKLMESLSHFKFGNCKFAILWLLKETHLSRQHWMGSPSISVHGFLRWGPVNSWTTTIDESNMKGGASKGS